MAEHDPNDELSLEELEDVAGGTPDSAGSTLNASECTVNNCTNTQCS